MSLTQQCSKYQCFMNMKYKRIHIRKTAVFTVGVSKGFYEHLFLSVHITFKCRQGKLKGHGGNSKVDL